MNFKQRLTNVLTVILILVGLYWSFMMIDNLRLWFNLVIGVGGAVAFTSTLSFLMGTGFKCWHKGQK